MYQQEHNRELKEHFKIERFLLLVHLFTVRYFQEIIICQQHVALLLIVYKPKEHKSTAIHHQQNNVNVSYGKR